MGRLCTMILAAGMLVSAAGAEANVSSGKIPTQPNPGKTQTKAAKLSAKKHKSIFVGLASWYGKYFQGRTTASGEPFDMNDLTAASMTLPLGSYAKVTNLRNGRWILVKINDRGPVVPGRILDLSYGAAQMLNMSGRGVERVKIEPVPAPQAADNEMASVFPQDQE